MGATRRRFAPRAAAPPRVRGRARGASGSRAGPRGRRPPPPGPPGGALAARLDAAAVMGAEAEVRMPPAVTEGVLHLRAPAFRATGRGRERRDADRSSGRPRGGSAGGSAVAAAAPEASPSASSASSSSSAAGGGGARGRARSASTRRRAPDLKGRRRGPSEADVPSTSRRASPRPSIATIDAATSASGSG